jgi:hypothetical protein
MAVALRDPIHLPTLRWIPDDLQRKLQTYEPRTDLGRLVRDCFRYLPAELAGELLDRMSSVWVISSALWAVRIDGLTGHREDFGIVSRKVVTDTGVGFIVDAFQNSVELENMKYHGIGTGTTAEAASQTALVTELTTEYNPNSTRATGTTTEGASANIFRTVGTNTIDSGTPAITEHAVLSQAATGGGVMLDRSVFSAINLVGANGDGLQTTYDLTCSSGG